jgi:tRNA threonylcarbamoyladenosine biosynthesis protein TsaB
MNVLAIESSTDILSVALRSSRGSAEASVDAGRRHAEALMGLVDFCMSSVSLAPRELELLACAQGPGSFTGLRIGMSTAKGMALGLGLPWKAVPTLDCLAWGYECFPGAVAPIVDGKKGRVYSALYLRGIRQGKWLDAPLAELAALLDTYPEAIATGPDADLFAPFAQDRPGFRIDRRSRSPAARALAFLAEEAFLREGPSADDEGPLYLRPSEAEETAAGAASGRE